MAILSLTPGCLSGVANRLFVAQDLGLDRFPSDGLIIEAISSEISPVVGQLYTPTAMDLDQAKMILAEQQGMVQRYAGVFSSSEERFAVVNKELGEEGGMAAAVELDRMESPMSDNDIALIRQAVEGHSQAMNAVLKRMIKDAGFFCKVVTILEDYNYSPMKETLSLMFVPEKMKEKIENPNKKIISYVEALVSLVTLCNNDEVFKYLLEVSVHSRVIRNELFRALAYVERYELFGEALEYYLSICDENPKAYFGLAHLAALDLPLVEMSLAGKALHEGVVEDSYGYATQAYEEYFSFNSSALKNYHRARREYCQQYGSRYRMTDKLLQDGMIQEVIDKANALASRATVETGIVKWLLQEATENYDMACIIAMSLLSGIPEQMYDFDSYPGITDFIVLMNRELNFEMKGKGRTARDEAYDKKLMQRIYEQALVDSKLMMVLAQFYVIDLNLMPRTVIHKILGSLNVPAGTLIRRVNKSSDPVKSAFWLCVMGGEKTYDIFDQENYFGKDIKTKKAFYEELVSLAKLDINLCDAFIALITWEGALLGKMAEIAFILAVKLDDRDMIFILVGLQKIISMLLDERENAIIDQFNQYLLTGQHELLDSDDSDNIQFYAYMILRMIESEYSETVLEKFHQAAPQKAYQFLCMAKSTGFEC